LSVDLRDFQKTKVYNAEDVVWGAMKHTVPFFYDVNSIVKYINKILKYKRVRKVYGRYIDNGPDINIEFCKRSTWSEAESHRIKIAAKGGTEIHALLIVHELAHVFQYRMHPNARVAAHGEEFCRIYLDLLRLVFGEEMCEHMIASFDAYCVDY
jgi:putative metallohydrolase (TIGR04338 family)